jgi:hypothetical protein
MPPEDLLTTPKPAGYCDQGRADLVAELPRLLGRVLDVTTSKWAMQSRRSSASTGASTACSARRAGELLAIQWFALARA